MIPTRIPSTVGSATQRATAQVPPAPSHLCTSLIKFGRPSNQALVVSGRGRSSHVARAGRRGSNSPSARSSPPKAPAPPLTAEEEEIRVQMARAMNATILRFHVPEYKTSPGNWLAIVGSLDELGEWSVHEGARMKWLPGHEWVADVILPEHYSGTFEYKLVMMNDKGLCVWEPGTNRRLAVAGRTSNDQPHIDISLQWGIREAEVLSDSEVEFPTAMLEAMYERAEQAVRAMPGINAATVLLQAQQQLSQSKTVHKEQVTSLRAQLVSLQQSSQRETNRVQTRMRELERTMETMQARLEQERKISEKHIELLKAQISEKKAEQAEAAARAEAEAEAAARAEEEAAAAAQEAQRVARSAPHISAYEPHVMALLPNYSGLTLERLHNMLAQAVFQPRYTRDTPTDLATLLADLVANNKIIADGAIYRYRSRDGSIVGSRSRARTPRAVSAAPAVSETVSATATETATVVDPRFLTLEPKVLACLDSASSGAGVPLERLVGLLRSVAPRAGCGLDQLALLMNHLEKQGKVVNDGGLYRHAKALQPVVDTVEMAPAPRVLQPVVDTVEMAPVQRTGTPVSPRRAHAPVPKRRATAPPPPEPETPFYGRTFTDGEQEYQAPQGSVAGGPPGSAGHGSLAPGGSIMPAFDSTGAHPTLDAVSQFERPVLEVLSRNGGLSMERLHMIMCSTYPKFANSSIEELAAVLKNLTDQHKIHNIDGTIAFVRF